MHWSGSSGLMHRPKLRASQSRGVLSDAISAGLVRGTNHFTFLYYSVWQQNARDTGLMCVCLAKMWCVKNQSCSITVFLARLDPVSEACRYHGPGCSARWCKCSRTCRLYVRFHSCTLLPSLASSICLIPTVPQLLASLTDGHTDLNWVQGLCSQNHPLIPFSLLTVREFQTLSIYSMSQQWVHPSHFSKHLIIHFHGTTLKKWHYDK